MLTDDPLEAKELATQLNLLNEERKKIEKAHIEKALTIINDRKWEQERIIVVGGEDWHEGVSGIVASRIMQKYNVPTIVYSLGKDNIAKASCRSINGISIHDALSQLKPETLIGFGGHSAAAGLSINGLNIDGLRHQLRSYMAKFDKDIFSPKLNIAGQVTPKNYPQAIHVIKKMEPFGLKMEEPIFFDTFEVIDNVTMGDKSQHARVTLRHLASGARANGLFFNNSMQPVIAARRHSKVNIAFKLKENNYNNNTYIQLEIVDYSC